MLPILKSISSLISIVLDTIKLREVCIMTGDFNAQVGEGAYLDCGIGPDGLGT